MLAAKLHSDNGLMAANSKATLTPIAAVAVDLECGYSEVTSPSRIGITAVVLAVLPADGSDHAKAQVRSLNSSHKKTMNFLIDILHLYYDDVCNIRI